MRTTIFLLSLLWFSTGLQAQERVTDLGFDKAWHTMNKVIAGYNLTYSHFGNIYFMVCSVRNGKLKKSQILFYKNGGFDTTEIKESDRAILEPVLLHFVDREDRTIIAPYINIEDPKKLPTGTFLYRQSVPKDLSKALYLITRSSCQSIIFPLSEGLKWKFSTS